MDFHEFPRRDLQALCKRNGVRANMTNAAMAEALAALPTVDGVEEYIKQPAAVPEPAGKAAAAEEEVRREKQSSPLPRGRRVTAKTTEVVKPDEGNGKEEEKAAAKQETNKAEDAPAIGVGRRGVSRRARPAPVVAAPAAKVAVEKTSEAVKPDKGKDTEAERADLKLESNREEDAPAIGVGRRGASRRARCQPVAEPAAEVAADKKGSPPPRARRAAARIDDGVEKVNREQETTKEDAPVQGAVRRGPSRSARPAPVVAESVAEPEVKPPTTEEDKQGSSLHRARRVTSKPSEPSRPDDSIEEDGMNQEKNIADVPAQVAGRRGPGRRARPAPVISKPAARAVFEELGSPPLRGRRVMVNVKSSAPISTEGDDEDEKKDTQLQADKEIAPALGVGRRCARGRARTEPALTASAAEVAAKKDAQITRGRRGKAKAPEPIKLNSCDEEGKEDVLVEDVLVRPTRARKPTMKAAMAEEGNVPRRATKKAATTNSTFLNVNDKQQVEPQEAVPALDSDGACYDLENVEEIADSQTVEQIKHKEKDALTNKDEQMEAILVRPTRLRKPTMKAVVAEEKGPRRVTKKAAPRSILQKEKQQEEPQEAVLAPVSDGGCYDMDNVEHAAYPQNVEHTDMIGEPNQEDKEAVPSQVSNEASYDPQNLEHSAMIDEPKQEDEGEHQKKQLEEPLVISENNFAYHIAEALPAPVSDEVCYNLENGEEAAHPQNLEHSDMIDGTNLEDKELVMNEDEILVMDETPEVKSSVTDEILMEESLTEQPPKIDEKWMGNSALEKEECNEKSPVEEQQVDSPILGLVSMFAEQFENDEDKADWFQGRENPPLEEQQVDGRPCGSLLSNLGDSPILGITSLFADQFEIDEDKAVEKSPMEEQQVDVKACGSLLPSVEDSPILGLTSMFADRFENDEDKAVEKSPLEEQQVDVKACDSLLISVEDSPILGLTSLFADQFEIDEDKAVENSLLEEQQVDVKACGSLLPSVEDSPTLGLTSMFADRFENNEDKAVEKSPVEEQQVDVKACYSLLPSVEESPILGLTSLLADQFEIDDKAVEKSPLEEQQVDVKSCGSLLPSVEDSPTLGLASMFADQFENIKDKAVWFQAIEKSPVEEQQVKPGGSLLPSLEDSPILALSFMFAEQFENDEDKAVWFQGKENHHADEKMEMAPLIQALQAPLTADESSAKDGFTFTIQADHGSKMDSSNSVQRAVEITTVDANDGLVCQEKAKEQTNTVGEAVVVDFSENIISAVEEKAVETVVSESVQNEEVTSDNVPLFTLLDGKSVVVEKAELVTEDLPHGSLKQNLVLDGEKSELVIAENVQELSETEDDDVGKECAFTGDLPCELDVAIDYTDNDNITSALLDSITETLAKITITEPTDSRNENVPICKNSSENTAEAVCKNCSEKNTEEPVGKNKSENKTAVLVAMQENMGGNVAKKSAELKNLTLGQLRNKLKKTLESKRVALGNMDGNVCRSN